ncbi:ABC transporter ATP-binding protein [Paracoccus sp. IB05]|uniref:ABC transporter ATP-binding protein n=1 Tax=Paracoccus sp. IB05 TaxID=2779367 RepID=UPI002105FBC1|nr:ABC transporter ATP-binding protein [Paracoccus sp. IB05]
MSLDIQDGEFLVLVGPSGCGKSILLRMISGLESIDGGEIRMDGKVVNEPEARDRDLAMIFQTCALFPHRTVRENPAFGMKRRKIAKAEAEARINAAAETLALYGTPPAAACGPAAPAGRHRPGAGARAESLPDGGALVNLDTKLRVHMRTEFLRLREMLKTTTLYVTHDQVEALRLGHRVCVMFNGKIQQVAPPDELFNNPANVFVAGFIGTPEMNLAMGEIRGDRLRLGAPDFPLPPGTAFNQLSGPKVFVGIRPTDFHSRAEEDRLRLTIRPGLVEKLGSENMVRFEVAARGAQAGLFAGSPDADKTPARGVTGRCEFTAALPGRTAVTVGQRLELHLAPGRAGTPRLPSPRRQARPGRFARAAPGILPPERNNRPSGALPACKKLRAGPHSD